MLGTNTGAGDDILKHDLKIDYTRKYLLRGYILGVLTHTTAWDRHWRGDETLN